MQDHHYVGQTGDDSQEQMTNHWTAAQEARGRALRLWTWGCFSPSGPLPQFDSCGPDVTRAKRRANPETNSKSDSWGLHDIGVKEINHTLLSSRYNCQNRSNCQKLSCHGCFFVLYVCRTNTRGKVLSWTAKTFEIAKSATKATDPKIEPHFSDDLEKGSEKVSVENHTDDALACSAVVTIKSHRVASPSCCLSVRKHIALIWKCPRKER